MKLFVAVQRSSASPDRGKYDWSRSPGGASDSGIAKCRKLDDKVCCRRNYGSDAVTNRSNIFLLFNRKILV